MKESGNKPTKCDYLWISGYYCFGSRQRFRSLMGRIPNSPLVPIYMFSLGYETIGGSALHSALSAQQGLFWDSAALGREYSSSLQYTLFILNASQLCERHLSPLKNTSPSAVLFLLSGFCFDYAVVIKWTFTLLTQPETRHKRRWVSDHH